MLKYWIAHFREINELCGTSSISAKHLQIWEGLEKKLQSWLPQNEGREGGREKEDVCEYEFYSQGAK